MSSHSERFSDDQAYSNHIAHSQEVSSKAAPSDEELNDSLKILTEKLSAALLNISAKEDLVNQHAKVAEEAVSGWEKAENEVVGLKLQLESVNHKNRALEDRVGHLDGALKECLRQLRQAREEQDQKIHEAVAKKSLEWESTKSELEKQLEAAKATDCHPKLEATERENSVLTLELSSRAEELKLRTIERDLSNQAAETASKQHLDSIKKVAKLEAESRRLKAVAQKASLANDHRSVTACVESFTDSQPDIEERLLVAESDDTCEPSQSDSLIAAEVHRFRSGRNLMIPSLEIDLMDDFLEMERLAALPDTENEHPLKDELEAIINRTAQLEEIIEKLVLEKEDFGIALTERENQLEISRDRLEKAEAKLLDLQAQLAMANEGRSEVELELEATNDKLKVLRDLSEVKLVELETQLGMANEATSRAEVELEATIIKKQEAESKLVIVQAELKTLLSTVCSLEEEVKKERAFSVEAVAMCQKLEDEHSIMQSKIEVPKATRSIEELNLKQDQELAVAATKFAECQKTIASLGRQLKCLATLEDFLNDSQKLLSLPLEISKGDRQVSTI